MMSTESTASEQTVQANEGANDGTPGREWFVIHTYSGYENKVKANLEHRI